MQLNAGQVLFRQGDPSDSIYIVINGRLRALQETEKEGAVETVAEFGQGESIGSVASAVDDSLQNLWTEASKFVHPLFLQ